jgi:hypothetical protein
MMLGNEAPTQKRDLMMRRPREGKKMIDGKYTTSGKSPIGVIEATLDFRTEGDKVTGTALIMGKEVPFEDGTCEGDDFSGSMLVDSPVGKMKFKVTGTVDGDDISGKMKSAMMTLKFSGNRI